MTGVVPSVVDNNDGTYTVKYTNLVKENNGENGGNKDNTDNNSKNNLNNKSDKKVDTADHSNNMIYYVLIAISATGIISAAAVAGRKKH